MTFLRLIVLGWWFVMSSGPLMNPTTQEIGPFNSLDLCVRARESIVRTITRQVSTCFEK